MQQLVPIEKQFSEVLQIIEGHRSRAFQYVNQEMLDTYWEVGKYVSLKIKSEEWGSKVVTQLSEYLRKQDPSLKSYGRSSIYNMKLFFETYSSDNFLALTDYLSDKSIIFQTKIGKLESDNQFVQTKVGQLQNIDNEKDIIVQTKFGQLEESEILKFLYQIPWSSHLHILSYCRNPQEQIFYILYANKERLKTRDLARAIQTDAFSHVLSDKKYLSAGMRETYPNANYEFKDTVFLDFLGLQMPKKESVIQKSIETNIREFMTELGRDFLFMDSQFPVQVGTKTLKIDLLFFHRALQCLVAVELKSGEFKPADMGQLEFYLEALDRDVKRSNENPSIGIILCKSSDKVMVEYAMSRSMSPAMIAEYKNKLIPREVLQKSFVEFAEFLDSFKK